jgi:HK97 family phage major capsid protein
MTRIYPNRPGGKPLDELTPQDMADLDFADLDAIVNESQFRARDLHETRDGTIRDKTPAEQNEFGRLIDLRDSAGMELQARTLEHIGEHPRSVVYGDGRHETRDNGGLGDMETAIARPGDLLARDQSVSEWVERRSGGRGRAGEPRVSFDRYLRAMVAGAPYGADAETRALSEGTLTAGGHLVPTPLAAQVIDLARNQVRVIQAGAVTVPMTTRTLKVPRLTAEGTPGWHSENAAITAADLTFDAVTFTAQTLTRLILLSIELFDDSDPSAEGVIANSFARQIALELDRAALRGSGTAPEPRGILNQTGVTLTAHGANGSVIGSPPAAGTMGWEFLVQAGGIVQQANFTPTAQIMNPRTNQSLSLLRDTTNQYIAPPRFLDGIPRLVTKQVPINLTVGTSTDCSEVYTGQWDQCWIGVRTDLRILPLRERFIDNGQYGFLAWMRADVQLAQPAAFNVDTGVRS